MVQADSAAQLAWAEQLLAEAQRVPEGTRLWLLTVTWQLLHEVVQRLDAGTPASEPPFLRPVRPAMRRSFDT